MIMLKLDVARNAQLNFRQQEETHLMENVIYNELCVRGFNVDVGVVEYNYKDEQGKSKRTKLEVDFVVNRGNRRCYILPWYDENGIYYIGLEDFCLDYIDELDSTL